MFHYFSLPFSSRLSDVSLCLLSIHSYICPLQSGIHHPLSTLLIILLHWLSKSNKLQSLKYWTSLLNFKLILMFSFLKHSISSTCRTPWAPGSLQLLSNHYFSISCFSGSSAAACFLNVDFPQSFILLLLSFYKNLPGWSHPLKWF